MERKYRILKKKDFQTTLKSKNQKIYSQNFVLYFLKTENQNIRFGYIIPKKFFKKAVIRNYYRRVTDNCIYQFKSFDELPTYNCVLYFKKEFAEIKPDYKNLKKEINKILFNFIKTIKR
ncbi:ribonuclease P protein component [Mycoplasmoides fastidiosum]|uniref:Ribonuclease P protein component n=1 Tax=Mycoplasmoides fastidiosum TaxID=92758 RepID=A0ABU0LYR4_9BACT|nr:ribonuclease P protein component [Mycoplasmoides fastidiosum]